MTGHDVDAQDRAAIAEYQAFIKANPRDELNPLLRKTIKSLRAQIRRRREVRRLVGGPA